MAALDSLGEGTAAEIIVAMPVEISNSAIRTHLRFLEKKGYVTYREDGPRYVYLATQPKNSAALSALQQVVQIFFGGSVERTVSMLVSEADLNLSDAELGRMVTTINSARIRDVEDNSNGSTEAK